MCMIGGKFLKEWQVTDKIIELFFFQFTFNFLQMTQTQEIITCRVLKIHEWMWGGGVYDWGKKFLNYEKWQIKLLSEFLCNFTFNLLQMTQTQEIITHRVSKTQEWIQGDVYKVGESYLRNDKWEIKLLSEFFLQFIFEILQMTQTQKIITHRVLKIYKWIWGDVYEWGKVS